MGLRVGLGGIGADAEAGVPGVALGSESAHVGVAAGAVGVGTAVVGVGGVIALGLVALEGDALARERRLAELRVVRNGVSAPEAIVKGIWVPTVRQVSPRPVRAMSA